MSRKVHLVCNAHLDPVWLWEWEEGAAEAISTFRVAAELCERFDTFIFNHNEVILYKWIEEYGPELFQRIARLERAGRWHIMGGWYLQPDCNMPSGESFVRQALTGRRYFKDKFDAVPTTAINFDPFGHTRGLVQILVGSGYDSYLFCRPGEQFMDLDSDDFTWVGFDGSEVAAHRVWYGYNSSLGRVNEKVDGWLEANPDADPGIILWGVGNHGGGPSKQDLEILSRIIDESDDVEFVHSTPEAYFAELRASDRTLPRREQDLNPWAAGCYTSQVLVKQRHRLLENQLYMVEKMSVAASSQGLMDHPADELHEATCDLMTAEFHDILPGSSITPAEQAALRGMDHALEKLSRIRARAFFALASGQPGAAEGEIPILVYNPHPWPVDRVVECEFNLADQNRSGSFFMPTVTAAGKALPTQVEKELSNLELDWRKRVVFRTRLAPSSMNRFDVKLEELDEKPAVQLKPSRGKLHVITDRLDVIVNTRTGLVDRWRIDGRDMVDRGAFRPVVMDDYPDPWGMNRTTWNTVVGRFGLMSKDRAGQFAGVETPLDAVRVIEHGAVRTVIEALMECDDSTICRRYVIPAQGTALEVHTRVYWNEKDRMLKLEVPVPGKPDEFLGQVAFGVQALPTDGTEAVAQKWVAVVDRSRDVALTCINDGVYGSDYVPGRLRLSLLRSAAYSGHPIGDKPIVPQDRLTPRIDQGERFFRLVFDGGSVNDRLVAVDRDALAENETPMALSFSPAGAGDMPKPLVRLSDKAVVCSCIKRAELDDSIIVRLFEPTGRTRTTTLAMPAFGVKHKLTLGGFEIVTLRVNPDDGSVRRCNLVEDIVGSST